LKGGLSYEDRKELSAIHGVSYSKIYKLEWDYKTNSDFCTQEVHGYPDEIQMQRALDKFYSWNRSKTHTRTHVLFKVNKLI
jgi:hypothetical protein